MRERRRGPDYSRWVLLILALLLPTASLIPLGGLWLWQHGYVVYWAIASLVVVTALYFLQKRLIAAPARALEASPQEAADAAGNPHWTARQLAAWDDVMALASNVRAERLSSRDAVLDLGLQTIE